MSSSRTRVVCIKDIWFPATYTGCNGIVSGLGSNVERGFDDMGILCVFCVYDTIGNRCFEKTSFPKTWSVFVQDVSHNINLMRIGKWRRLNMISRRLNIPTQRFLFAWERRHSFWFRSRFCKRFTWSAGARIPDVTSFTLILCVLRMCETHCFCESDYIGVYTLLLFCEYH